MKAGQLDKLVSIQQQSSVQDDAGQPVKTWSEVTQAWADVRSMSGLATIKADAYVSTFKASVRIRYRDGIKPGMRVVHGATVYDIKAVPPDSGRREFLDLVCEVRA
jgi:SPP1 family predicted phage head-tail adaptor